MAQSIDYGPFRLTYGTGIELEHRPSHCTIYFQPGDDSAAFLDRLEAEQDHKPGKPIVAILHDLYQEFRP